MGSQDSLTAVEPDEGTKEEFERHLKSFLSICESFLSTNERYGGVLIFAIESPLSLVFFFAIHQSVVGLVTSASLPDGPVTSAFSVSLLVCILNLRCSVHFWLISSASLLLCKRWSQSDVRRK